MSVQLSPYLYGGSLNSGNPVRVTRRSLASSYLRDRSKLTSDVTILRPFLCAKDRSLQAIYLITIARNAFNDAKRTEWAMHEIFQ